MCCWSFQETICPVSLLSPTSLAYYFLQAVQVFQVFEPPKAAEVQTLRLKNADLQHEIERIERKLKDSDRLSGVWQVASLAA